MACPKIVPFQKGRAFRKSLDSLEEKNNGKCTGSVAKTLRTEKKKSKLQPDANFKGSDQHGYGVSLLQQEGKKSRHISREVPLSPFAF